MSSLTNKYVNNRSMNGLLNIYANSIESSESIVNDTLIVDGQDITITIEQVNENKTNLTGITYIPTPTPTTQITNYISLLDPYDLTKQMIIYYDAPYAGFRFLNNIINGYMYFSVLDPAGNKKNFQFHSSQMYADVPFYVNNWLTISYNNDLTFGDRNSSVWFGSRAKFIPTSNPQDGFVFYTKGFNNNTAYYTNFTHNDLSNVETPTLRMNYANIWSKVKHTFENAIDVTGTATLNNALNVSGTTNLSTTYFNGNINALFISNFYNDLYLLTSAKLFVNGTTGITQNELSYLSGTTSNIQTQLNGKLNLSGGTMTGALVVNNTITTNNNITQTGTTATTNRIIQPRIVGDINNNPNMFKYSVFSYNNSGNTTASAVLTCREEVSSNSMLFFPKLGAGSYNPIVQTDDRGIFSFFPFNTGAITLTCWADTRVGVRVATPTSTTSLVDIWAKNCNLNIDSANNVLISANNSTSSTPDLRILNTGSARGIQFISNTTLSASNTFVGASEALITTQTQNNSSLVLTTSNSALNYGIRILSNSSTTATITTKVANNSIVMNQTDTTVNGPISFQGTSTFSTGTSFPFGFDVGNGNIALNRTDATLFNYITSNENLVLQSKKIYLTTSSAQSIDHWSDNHYFRDNTGTGACNVYVNGNISLTSNVIFNDATQQQTAYTNALNTKLNAIGTLLTSSLSATTTLTNNTIFNCGSISLTTGTWILSINCCVAVITGTTTVSELLAGYSTSSTSLSQSTNLSINNWNGTTLMSVGSQCCLTSTNTVVVASTTTYYMLTRVLFGTASRMQFVQGNSSFTATRIA